MTDDILHPAGIGAETSDRGNPEPGADILHTPNLQQAALRALVNVPTNEDNYDARVRAKTLSEALGKAIALAKRDSGKNEGDTPEEADRKDRVQADAIGAVLSGRHDYYGSMWNGRKPFATGAEYAQHMRSIVLNGPSAALSEDSKKFYAADYDTQCQIAAEKEGVTEYLKGAAADVLDAFRVTKPLTRAEEAEADEETIRASATLAVGNMGGTDVPAEKYKAAEQKVREYRDQRRREEIRSKYEAKLNRENAWNALTTILPTLSDNAQECAKAILDSDNNALPVKYYAKFNGLSERERNLLIQTRQLSADKIDSGFWNTIEDAFIGAGNITGNILTAPVRQGVKFVTMARNSAKDPVEAGIDVNNIAITRQLLWQATGDPFAGGDLKTGQLPQLQFEQVCDEHGVAGEAVIGAISTLPYMGAAMIPYAGPALVALEAMQEMDDHVALNGGDITDPGYIVSSFVLGGLYAYVERLQVEKLIGGVGEQGVREGLLKGFYAGIKNGTVPRVLFAETLSESLQEGLQNGIMAINNAYALNEDVVRSFGEAFVEDFIGSLGTMAIIGAGGTVLGHMKRSGWHLRGTDGKAAALLRQEERSTDLTNVYLAEFAHNNMVKAFGRSDEIQEEGRRRQQSALWGFWQEGGKAGLIEKAGVSDKAAENLDRLFTSIREAEGATAKADEALQKWNRGRGVTSAPKAGESGGIGQQYLEQLVGGAIRGEISEEDFVGRLMDLGFSARGARDYAAFTTLENRVITEQRAVQSFLQGRYEREAGSEDAQNADYEKVQGAIRDLDRARSVWAQGFGIYRSEEGGKITDPGAAALEKFGFVKEDAERLSRHFHYERAAAFSPIALDGIRAMYERATRGKVSAKAAIASEFQGRVVRFSTGTDANGKPVYGDFIRFTRNGQTGYVQILDSKTGAPDFSKGNVLIAESIAEATKHKKTPITVQQWMDATPAKRENLWNQYHLYDEGFFTKMTPTELTVAADPSARVDSEQAKILLYGTITLATDPSFSGDKRTLDTIGTVDSSAGFHEIYHAWSYFMQQTGKWSEKDDEELRKKYGREKSGGHNEEAAANALRAYINRRIEGRMTGEDEKSPFAKVFALARRLLRYAEEKKIKERSAATAEEAFFDQIIADRFTGVGAISSQSKPAENGKTSAPAYPPGEASGVADAKRSAPQMPGRADSPADKGATEPENKPEEPTKRGSEASEGAERSEPEGRVSGRAQRGWTAYTPTGNVKVSGHYAVVNLADVVHSNNPAYALYMRAQLRNRKDNKAEEDTRKSIADNFEPERLLEATDTANGAPIVFVEPDEHGVLRMFVLSGNGRILVLNDLASRHMYDKYRNVMKAWAAENGLEVPEGETPVLVRVIDDYGGATRDKVADLSNTNSIQQYTEEEQARADAEVIKALGIAGLYHANTNGSPDMTPGVNDDFFAEFIRGVGDSALYNSDLSLTETARVRAVRALLAIAVGQGVRGRDVVRKLIEQTDTLNIVKQKNAAAIMAAAVAALEANDAYSIGPDVSRAMADYIDFAEKKKSGKAGNFEEYFAQMDLIDGPSEIAREILKLFGGRESAADIAEYVIKYCEAAAQSDPTGGLFGEAGARTRIEIWRDAVKTVDEGRGKNAERHSISSENYGVGSSVINGPGFVDLEPGDTFGVIEEYVRSRIRESVSNAVLGIDATIGSARNANHLAKKMSSFGDENAEAHKYAVKNVLQLFAKSNLGIVHHDKNGGPNDYVRVFTPFSFGGAQYAATITLRRDNGGDKLYTVEAVEIENAEGSPRTSDHMDRQEAQPSANAEGSPRSSHHMDAQGAQHSASLRDRIAYYVGDVNATQPKFVGRIGAEAFSVGKLLEEVEGELAQTRRQSRHSVAGVDFVSMAKYYDGGVRDIARRIKSGDGKAIETAAAAMAPAISPGDVLIPVPSHDGRAHDTLLLADAISRITGSPVVEAIRGTVRDPIYDLKARGYLPDAEDLGFYRAADIPEDRRAVFIDNVVGTGTTAVAARQALGRGHVVAFAWDHTAPHPVGIVGGLAERHSISSLYTGSAADYEKPSPSRIELLETHRGTDASRRFSTVSAAIDSLKDARTANSVTEAGEKLKANGAVNKPLTNLTLGLTAKITGNGLSKMTSEKATKKSRSPYLHALAVANADKIFECAFADATHPDTHGRKEVSQVHRLGSMLYDPQTMRFEPVLVTMLEYKRDGGKVYTIEAIDVDAYQKKNSAGQLVAFANGERQTPIAEYADIIANSVAAFNGGNGIAEAISDESRLRRMDAPTLTDSPAFKAWFADSKIVDGEGRPLRVYRGAAFNPVKQPDGKGVIKPMSYFSADPDYARRYGEVEAYYLKIEHPFDIRDPECEADFKKVYPNVTLARGDSGALDWAEAATVDDEFLEENFPGKYDGIIFDEQKDWTTEGNTAKWRGLSYVPLFGGSQVKSATDNRGTFDPKNPDVRFSMVATPWRPDFPDAVAHTTRAYINGHYAEIFNRAKAGDVEAAADLVEKVCKVDKIRQLGKDYPNVRLVAPVVAFEKSGHNQIPRMFARYVAEILGIDATENIVQSVRAGHTGADASHRLFTSPEFDGEVVRGAEYIIVDDHITQGGTINALRDYIERNGGKVVAVSALTLSQGSSILSPHKDTLDELYAKWPDIDNLLRIGGIAESAGALTQSQAKYILKFSPDTFRDRAVAQGNERGGRVRQEALGASPSAEVSDASPSAPRRSFSTVGSAYPALNRLSDPQLVVDLADALDEIEGRSPIFPSQMKRGGLAFGDVESRSRHAIRSDLQENANKAAEEALTNYLTYFRLSHRGTPRVKTIARIGLAMGMNVVNMKRLLDKSASRAEQVRGTLIEKAAANGDVATTLALLKREDGVDDAVGKLIEGGISKGGELTRKGVGQINSIIGKRVEQMMRDFTAASLADMEGETGLDIAAEILEQNPDAFADEVTKAKGTDPEKPQDDEGSDTDVPGGGDGDESGLSDYERHKRAVAREEALKKVEAFIAAAKARAAENKAKAEERRKRHETVDLPGDGNGEGSDGEAGLPHGDRFDPTPKNVKANFKSKEEFAAFMRVWAEHKFDETHGISTLGKTERDKLFAEFYRITVKQELQDLADKLLAPKDENGVTISRIAKLGNGARIHVNRRLAEMEKGVRPDTIERMSAEIFAFINSAAIRVSRTDLVKEFKKRIRDGYIKGAKYEDLKLDADRRVTGWVEEAARYICRVCDLSKREINGLPSQLAAERKELHDIINRRADVYDESGKQVAKAAVEDMETKKAMWKLALLDKYGAMTSLMPGEILDLQNQAIEYLDKQAADLEQLWRDTRAYEEGIRRDLAAAIVAPGGQRYKEKGWLDGRLFDALNGLIRLRLQHLTRFASDADRQKASEAINKIIVMLGDGETQYSRALQDDRRALFEGLGRIFQKPEGGVDNAAIKKYLDRMTQPIPKALAQQISNQGFADSMTYGQMLQLLVSLEQRSFREAIEHNGRQGQADLIRNFETADEKGVRSKVFTAEDNQFVEWLRAFYAAKRDVISPVTLRMVGQKVDSPDPLYCPVKRSMEDRVQALAEAGSSWDPIAAVFTRRIRNNRDFDEQASVIGMFFDRSDETARLLAWAERGTVIRGVFTSVGVQSAIRRAFGPGELRKIMTQLLATFNGGESRKKSPGELAAVDKALNFTTYAYLGFNPLSAIKQTTSFMVWANALPGGFRDLWKYMSHFDRAALKHLKESDEFKLRYGDDVGSGQDLATKGLNENPGMNPVARMLSGAGMWLLKKGDFAPGGWIAQGLYKDLLNKHLNEGMEFDAADRLAITETFNMLEETQQSGRTYNTNMLTIEHGRIGRLLTQFATSPLQQLQYETQAYREWRDMVRYNMGEKKIAAARQKLVRAVVINHLLLPAALNFVTAMFKLAMGDEPPWEKDGYHWSILTDVLMGQFSRVFFIGAFSQTALKALFMREYPRGSQMLPVEGALGMAASVCITAHDVATLNAENIRKDLERMLKATAPTRIPYGIYRRLVGDSDMDRKKAKKGAGKK